MGVHRSGWGDLGVGGGVMIVGGAGGVVLIASGWAWNCLRVGR